MDCVLHQMAELNEDAAYEMSSGRPGTAIVHLEEAAGRLMDCLTRPSLRTSTTTSSSCSHTHWTSRVQIPHLHDELFYIYSCAVSYNAPTSTSASSASQSDVIFELAVVLFNLALAHHQQGNMRKQTSSLQLALTYYKECYQALQSLSNTEANSDNEDILLLTLAVLNNQAQILYQQEQRHASTDVVVQKLMTHSMHAMVHQQHEHSNLSMVEQSQIHEFVQNAMLFRLDRPEAAPSA